MKNIVICAFLLVCTLGLAQEKTHQISVYGGGIFGRQSTELLKGKTKSGEGFNAGLGYRYYINPNWSIGTGAEYQYFDTSFSLSDLSDSYHTADIDGDAFEFRYTATKYRETQTVHNVAVPLNIQFETSGLTSWYMNIGVKAGFNLSANYQTEINKLTTSGYFPEWNVELNDPRFMGFGTWNNVNAGKQDLELKTAFMLTAESGVKQDLSDFSRIYIGLYVNYGLNNLQKQQSGFSPVSYNPNAPEDFTYTSLLNAQNSKNQAYTDAYKLISFGIKIQWAFGF